MAAPVLSRLQFEAGTWRGVVSATEKPVLRVTVDGREQDGLTMTPVEGAARAWSFRFTLPATALGAGLTLFRLVEGDTVLAELPVLAGAPLEGDPRAEIAALRAELDLVKRVLRRLDRD